MLRKICGRYKQGRSTAKEGILLKLKPFEDSEAIITGFEELQHNENEQFTSELGYSKRSSQQAGLVGGNTLGKFLVTGTQEEHFGGVEFKVGSGLGLTQALRQEIWDNREKYLGKLIKFKYQKIGSIDKPRIPIFLGFRDASDMSPTPTTQSTNWNSGFGFCPKKNGFGE
jgi:DNA ligase-1